MPRKTFELEWKQKKASDLEVGEITYPHQSGRFRGVSIARRKEGFFVCTHRARSGFYSSLSDIPDSVIAKIESTG